eukprot:scaffold1806_cov240-Pinguiococcus_pyrenoidosus.AAC.37
MANVNASASASSVGALVEDSSAEKVPRAVAIPKDRSASPGLQEIGKQVSLGGNELLESLRHLLIASNMKTPPAVPKTLRRFGV